MLLTTVVTASAIATLTLAETTIAPSQSSQVRSDINVYVSSLLNGPNYSSIVFEIATAVPAAELSSIVNNDINFYSGATAVPDLLAFATAPSTHSYPTWVSNLPTNVRNDLQRFATSANDAEHSIVRSDLGITIGATVTSKASARELTAQMLFNKAAGAVVGVAGLVAIAL